MKVFKKPVVLDAYTWPGGGVGELPDWLAPRVLRYEERRDVLVLKNGIRQVSAAAGDTIIRGENGDLEAMPAGAFTALFQVAEDQSTLNGHRIAAIARVCHEVNRAYCLTLGDASQQPWQDAPGWQRESAIDGVKFRLTNPAAPPSASHDNWLQHKAADGWTYGPEKDAEKKTHPCMVPFDALPLEQQAKDYLFAAVVSALS